jgi:glycosyltransferase involved in cell wall biosynthesis
VPEGADTLRTLVELSIVIPVYGCAQALGELHRRLTETIVALGVSYEIVFVDDRSPDDSWSRLEEIAAGDPAVRALRLSRNFGQQAAVTAGLEHSRGNWTVIMDCDLQDPPELIPEFYACAQEGNQIVYGYQRREGASTLRRLASRTYFRLLNTFAGTSLDDRAGSFCLMSRQVVTEFLRFKDRHRQYLLVLNWLGFESGAVEYEQSGRHSGGSSYTLRSLLAHTLDGIFFQTTVLLRWVVFVGFLISLAGVGVAIYVLLAQATGSFLPGWSSLAIFTLTIGGFIILSTGITGLYVGRTFEQVRERPIFVVEKEVSK